MSSPVIFFLVAISTILSIDVVDSKPTRDLDNVILEYLKQIKGIGRKRDTSSSDSTDSDDSLALSDPDSSSDDDILLMRQGELRKDDIFKLIDKINRIKNKRKEKNDVQKPSERITKTSILEELLSRNMGKMEGKKDMVKRLKKRMAPNTLLPFKLNDDDNNVSGLEKYSKIYIVLNPSAVSRDNAQNSLNDLVSKMLSQNSAATEKERSVKSMQKRYKGFVVRENLLSRRARRESKEGYGPKDTIEDDYKGKRLRNDRGGGGGGGGGRTAIPYIRHRGDIYERDN